VTLQTLQGVLWVWRGRGGASHFRLALKEFLPAAKGDPKLRLVHRRPRHRRPQRGQVSHRRSYFGLDAQKSRAERPLTGRPAIRWRDHEGRFRSNFPVPGRGRERLL